MRSKPNKCYEMNCPLATTCSCGHHLDLHPEDGHCTLMSGEKLCECMGFASKGKGFVLGVGDPVKAKLAIILEAPGKEEISFPIDGVGAPGIIPPDELERRRRDYPELEEKFLKIGAPIVGRSGALINQWILPKVGISRPEIFVDNTIRCLSPNNKQGNPYPVGEEKSAAESCCRVYDRIQTFSDGKRCSFCNGTIDLYEAEKLPENLSILRKAFPYPLDEKREGKAPQIKSKEEILFDRVRGSREDGFASSGIPEQNVRILSENIQGDFPGKGQSSNELLAGQPILQQTLFFKGSESGKESSLEGGKEQERIRIHSNLRSLAPSNQESDKPLRTGTQISNRKILGEISSSGGRSTSQERDQGRQSVGEFGSSIEKDTQRTSSLSQMPISLLREIKCPHCRKEGCLVGSVVEVTLHPASLLREVTPLPLVIKDMEKASSFIRQGYRTLVLMGGKAAGAFLGYAENVSRWRGHYEVLTSPFKEWYDSVVARLSSKRGKGGGKVKKLGKAVVIDLAASGLDILDTPSLPSPKFKRKRRTRCGVCKELGGHKSGCSERELAVR